MNKKQVACVQKQFWLISGLGNPGPTYEKTLHNSGFLAVDLLAQKLGVSLQRIRFQSLLAEVVIAGQTCILQKPLTYMNNSGRAVKALLDYFKIDPGRLITIYDDIDLPAGRIRIRAGGGAGTHNGMKSLIEHLQTQDFPRIRIGIGPKPENWELADYVLARLGPEQQQNLQAAAGRAADAAKLILEQGLEEAMANYNKRQD
jgi:PTH1 family peptidyl-tRNA hydrolase